MRAGPFLGVYFVHCWAAAIGRFSRNIFYISARMRLYDLPPPFSELSLVFFL